MSVTDRDAALSATPQQDFADALDQVLFHMGSALDEEQTNMVAGHLERRNVLPAAEAMASIGAEKRRRMSREDRNLLRLVIETYDGNRTDIDRLDSQAVLDAPTVRIRAPRFLGLA
ncbi:hypothetical protein [Saccharopolyspora spinosa]|uniref:Uncharacterized protein n=1 Tax=Saccharopolyspora spinosa TaxID=60894 RepID=A0A2N3Y510_SACSN|nr:hypothetical protein [Saccharopolyspora spinosa]PKW17990.1 hypothetical protein A8926_6033 [Saccharopolyspora spinosa]